MTTLVAVLVLGTAWPKNLTVGAAGFSAESRELTNACWHDKKSGYFAYKMLECDGAHRMITLTRDRRMVEESGYDTARFGRKSKIDFPTTITERAFSPATSHGIKIGMAKAEVLKRLGKPSKSVTKGSKNQYWCALYKKAVMEDKENGEILRNTYIFKNSKLIEIAINLDSIPGCGEDSLSDEGWPWSKF